MSEKDADILKYSETKTQYTSNNEHDMIMTLKYKSNIFGIMVVCVNSP